MGCTNVVCRLIRDIRIVFFSLVVFLGIFFRYGINFVSIFCFILCSLCVLSFGWVEEGCSGVCFKFYFALIVQMDFFLNKK